LDNLITQTEAARLRGRSRHSIIHLMKRGKLRTYVVAGHRLLDRTEVLSYEVKPGGRPRKKKSEKLS
jgi:hypothetical protein